MRNFSYVQARELKNGHEVIVDGLRRHVTFKQYVKNHGVGHGEGPDYIYIVLSDGQVWEFGSWAEVSRGKLVSWRPKSDADF